MPTKSAKQEKFMQAVANNPKFAKKVGVPVTVGQEFTKSGGGMKKMSKGGGVMPSKMGAVKTAAPSKDGVAVKGKTKGKQVTMAGSTGMKKGGMTKMKKGGYC
jgi:hypothetical protein